MCVYVAHIHIHLHLHIIHIHVHVHIHIHIYIYTHACATFALRTFYALPSIILDSFRYFVRRLVDRMADRVCLTVPAGQRLMHKIPCNWEEDSGDGTLMSVALGSLDWNAIVLDEKTVDLEVCVLLKSEEASSEPPTMHWLQQKRSGRTFQGRFVPSEDSSFLEQAGKGATMEEIIFEFDNSYSWWTDKQIELITIRCRSEANPPPLPLPSLSPMSLPPRASDPSGSEEVLQEVPELRTPNDVAAVDENTDASRFISQLDAFLAVAEEKCEKDDLQLANAEGLLAQVQQLRQTCKDMLQSARDTGSTSST